MEIFGNDTETILIAIYAGLGIGSIYALVAIGYNLIYSATNVFNLAQGDIVSWGGLVAFSLIVTHGLPLPAAVFVIILTTAVMGLLVERIAVAPLVRVGSFGWVLTTLGVSVALRNIAELQWGTGAYRVPSMIDEPPVDIFGAPFRVDFIVTIAGAVILIALLELADRRTLLGKAFVATAFDREAAQLRGINVGLLGVGSFVIAGALGGLAGYLIAPVTFASFNSGELIALKGFIAIAIGGWGRHFGPLVGGLLIGVAESVAIVWISAGWRDVIPLFVLFAVLLWRTQGLFGRAPQRVI